MQLPINTPFVYTMVSLTVKRHCDHDLICLAILMSDQEKGTTQLTDIKGKSIVEGAKVYARWKNGSKYFEGTIVSLDLEKRTAHVHYADGDVDRAVPSTHIMVSSSIFPHICTLCASCHFSPLNYVISLFRWMFQIRLSTLRILSCSLIHVGHIIIL